MPGDVWVFDTGPLRHFATHGWLAVLRFLTHGRRVLIPDTVERELREATDCPDVVRTVPDEEWIGVHRRIEGDYGKAFARYHDRLVVDRKNLGECGVLAMGDAYGYTMVIDDSTPRRIAEEKGMSVTATVPLLCDAIRAKKLTTAMVEHVADDLLSGDYYLPFGPGGFRQHVLEHGLLDYDEL